MLRNGVQLHDGSAVEKGHVFQAVNCWHGRTRTCVDENLPGGEYTLAAIFWPDEQGLGAGETGFAEDQLDIGGLLNACLAGIAKTVYDIALALPDAFHVDANVAGVNAVIGASPRQISDAGAGDHGLGGSASHVDAGTADILALDDSGAHSGFSQRRAKRFTGLPGADHYGIELLRSSHKRTLRLLDFRPTLEPRDDKQPQPDCDQVFRNGDSEVGRVQGLHQADASAITAKRSRHRAKRRDDRSQPKRCASGDAQTCTAKQAHRSEEHTSE